MDTYRSKCNIVKLREDNYEKWARLCRGVLREQGVWKHVDPNSKAEVPNEDKAEYKKWRDDEVKAHQILGNTVSIELLGIVRRANTAREAWEELRRMLQTSNEYQMTTLYESLFAIKMGNKTLIQYNREFDLTLKRLRAGGEVVALGIQKVIYMRGLSEDLKGWKDSNASRFGNDTPLSVVRKELKAELDRRKNENSITQQRSSTGVIMNAKTTSVLVAQKVNTGSGKTKKKMGACHYCGKQGHFKKDCRKRIAEEAKAKVESYNGPNVAYNSIAKMEAAAYNSATAHNNNVSTGLGDWIAGSAASHHMVGDKKAYCRYMPFNIPIIIRGISDMDCQAVGAGDVKFTDENGHERTLSNVLYVPGLSRGLISISKLTKLRWEVSFMKDCGSLRDRDFCMTIKVREGLYVLENATAHAARIQP